MPNDHYIPQFYLKNFTIPNTDQIFVYRRDIDIFRTNIRNVASINNFYTYIDKKLEKNRKLEQMFSSLESDTAPIISRVIDEGTLNLNNNEKIILSNFIAFLFVRDYRFRIKIKNYLTNFLKKSQKMLIQQNKEAYKRYLGKGGIKFEDDKKFEEFCKLMEDEAYDLKYGNEDYFLALSIKSVSDLISMILSKAWTLFISKGEEFFITSDSPISLVKNSNYPDYFGLGFLNDLVLLPVSPKKCILLSNYYEKENAVINLGDDKIKKINQNTMIFSDVSLFTNISSEEIKERFNKIDLEKSRDVKAIIKGKFLISQFEDFKSSLSDKGLF